MYLENLKSKESKPEIDQKFIQKPKTLFQEFFGFNVNEVKKVDIEKKRLIEEFARLEHLKKLNNLTVTEVKQIKEVTEVKEQSKNNEIKIMSVEEFLKSEKNTCTHPESYYLKLMRTMKTTYDLNSISDKKIINALIQSNGNTETALFKLCSEDVTLDYYEKHKFC